MQALEHDSTMKKKRKAKQKKAKATSMIIAKAIAKAVVLCRGDTCVQLVCDVESNDAESDSTK